MKSKRKQVNSYHHREKSEQGQPLEKLKRTTGSKPFQLAKVRSHKRASLELISNKGALDHIHHRHLTGPQEAVDSKDVYFDLIVKKKMIIDNQHNQILQSERKNLFYEEVQQTAGIGDKSSARILETLKVKATCCLNRNEEIPFDNDNEEQQQASKKRRTKCPCCLSMNCYLTQAVIERKTSRNPFHPTSEGSNSEPDEHASKKGEKAGEFDLKIELKNIKDKAEKSPFSFTSMKWRTKSQIFQVDKWKERYGGKNEIEPAIKRTNSLAKIIYSKPQFYQRQEKFTAVQNKFEKVKLMNQIEKKLFPSISKTLRKDELLKISEETNKNKNQDESSANQEGKMQSSPVQELKAYSKKNEDEMMQKEFQQEKFQEEKEKQRLSIEKQSEKGGNDFRKSSKQFYSLSPGLSTTEKADRNDPSLQKEKINPERKQESLKKRKKKDVHRFPLIQGSGIQSVREVEEVKKRKKVAQPNRISPHSWRQKLPKKIYLEKMMEAIPERWQYGESRQSSRQVDQYLKFKEEEELKEIQARQKQNQEEKRQMQSELAAYTSEELQKIAERNLLLNDPTH